MDRNGVAYEVSRQLREIIPELKKSLTEQTKRDVTAAISANLSDLIANEVKKQLKDSMEDVDNKITYSTKQISSDIAKSQLALIKASHKDISSQVSRDIARVVNEKIAPQLNNFILNSAMNNADHTEMVTNYRHGVDQDVRNPARVAINTANTFAIGGNAGKQRQCALPPAEEKKFTARFVLD